MGENREAVENTETENKTEKIHTTQPARIPVKYVRSMDDIKTRKSSTLYQQYFIYDNFATTPKDPVMQLYYSGHIDREDIKILDFIYETRFSLQEQLVRFCDINGIENGKERVNIMYTHGLINKFFIASYTENKALVQAPRDGLYIYCLRRGGKYLLDEYSNRLFVEWDAGRNITQLKNIENQIILNEIYLDTISSKAKVNSWFFNKEFYLREKVIKANLSFNFQLPDESREYLLYDIIRKEDNIEDVQIKIRRWEEYLVTTKFWMRSFIKTNKYPMLVFVTDDDETASALAETISLTSKMKIFLITTFDRTMNKALNDSGRFLKYSNDDKTLYEITYNLFGSKKGENE
jgi:hypothetical protein